MSEEQLVYKKKKKKFKIFPIVNVIFFILVSLLILFPMWKVIVDSFDAHSATSFRWWPNAFSVGGYNAIFSRSALYSPFVISVVTTLVGTFMGLLLATLGGYVLIQWDMPGRNFFAYMLLFTMIFDGGMVPKYLVMQNLHLLDTLWAVILPMSINVYNLVLMRNFFEGIPESLFEAAQIDGCSPMGIFFKKITPKAGEYTMITGFLIGMLRLVTNVITDTGKATMDGAFWDYTAWFWQTNWLVFECWLLVFLIIFMVVVSCFTPAPSKEQVEAITFTSDFKKSIRESWSAFDIIGTLVVIGLCAAFYAYFW